MISFSNILLFSQAASEGAPVTYVQLYEDKDVTIGVFILKRGTKIPLHDHPDMHGILKVRLSYLFYLDLNKQFSNFSARE